MTPEDWARDHGEGIVSTHVAYFQERHTADAFHLILSTEHRWSMIDGQGPHPFTGVPVWAVIF